MSKIKNLALAGAFTVVASAALAQSDAQLFVGSDYYWNQPEHRIGAQLIEGRQVLIEGRQVGVARTPGVLTFENRLTYNSGANAH